MVTSPQKCWYCKRNNAEKEFLNIIDKTSTDVEIKGIYKVKNTKYRTLMVVRCKECYNIHKNVSKNSKYLSFATFILLFLYLIINNSESLSYSILYAAFLGFIIYFVFKLILGYTYAIKYKTKAEWSRGGFF